jgi:hypothetical protein
MALRSMCAEDVEAVADLWRKSWSWANQDITEIEPLPHWIQRVQSEFCEPYKAILLENYGAIIGFTVFQIDPGYVQHLYTNPYMVNQRNGTILLEYAEELMTKPWSLHVGINNLGAQRFYLRKGLEQGVVSINPNSGRYRMEYVRR